MKYFCMNLKLCQVAEWSDDRDEVRLSWYLPNNFVQPQPR